MLLLNVCNILVKELETINWVFGIDIKIVNTTTDKGSNFVKPFNVHGEMAKTVEEESSDEERSSCSSGNDDQDTTQPVQLLPILEGDNDEKGAGVFLPKHMHCASRILNLLVNADACKTLNKCPNLQKVLLFSICKSQRLSMVAAKEIWNKQCRSSKTLDITKDNIGVLLQVLTVIQWNSVYDAVG